MAVIAWAVEGQESVDAKSPHHNGAAGWQPVGEVGSRGDPIDNPPGVAASRQPLGQTG